MTHWYVLRLQLRELEKEVEQERGEKDRLTEEIDQVGFEDRSCDTYITL